MYNGDRKRMKSITFEFMRLNDILDLFQNETFRELIEDKSIKCYTHAGKADLTVFFNEPFDSHTIQAVFDLVYTYTIYN